MKPDNILDQINKYTLIFINNQILVQKAIDAIGYPEAEKEVFGEELLPAKRPMKYRELLFIKNGPGLMVKEIAEKINQRINQETNDLNTNFFKEIANFLAELNSLTTNLKLSADQQAKTAKEYQDILEAINQIEIKEEDQERIPNDKNIKGEKIINTKLNDYNDPIIAKTTTIATLIYGVNNAPVLVIVITWLLVNTVKNPSINKELIQVIRNNWPNWREKARLVMQDLNDNENKQDLLEAITALDEALKGEL